MAQKLYNTKFCSCKHDQDSYKRQPIACQLHSDWLQMTRFLVVIVFIFLVSNVVTLPPIAIEGVHWARDGPKFVCKVDGVMHLIQPSTT
jgi:hypothetical protein